MQAPPRQHFKGNQLLLNKLNTCKPSSEEVESELPLVSLEDLLWHRPFLRRALLTSYGVDYHYVGAMLRGSPADANGEVIIVDHDPAHSRRRAGFDATTHAQRLVVMPEFHAVDATQLERSRMERGCMHSKLMLLAFDGGARCAQTPFMDAALIKPAQLLDPDRFTRQSFSI
eukprot:4769186-Pleurochrysis_carterae.AAC.8